MTIDLEDARRVAQRMESFIQQIEELSDRIGSNRHFDRDEKRQLSELFAALKHDLAAEEKRCNGPLTDIEDIYLKPAIRDAIGRITAKINSGPDSWGEELQNSVRDFSIPLFNLRQWIKSNE